MLITLGKDRSNAADRRLACALAAIAGAVNTVAFHAVGFFSANMTGNVSAISDNIALGQWLIGVFYLTIVVSFIGGAALSVILINAGARRGIPGIYALGILAESLLMSLLACVELWLPAAESGPVLVLGLSFLMGLQNAIVTRLSDSRVRSTHVSGMATDIGIELALLFDTVRGHEKPADAPQNWLKLRLHSQTVLSFLVGGALGVMVYQAANGLLLFVAAALLMALALKSLLRVRKKRA